MNFDEIPPKDKALLDLVLEGKSDTFKARVFEIVHKFKLDASDPSFLLLLSTGQLQALLEEFPAAFETLFMNLLGAMQRQHQQMLEDLRKDVSNLREIVQGAQTTNEELVEGLKGAVEDLQQFSEDQKESTVQRVKEILDFAQRKHTGLTEEVKRKEKEERKARGEAYQAALQKSAKTIITQAGGALKQKHTQELILPLVLGTLAFVGMGGGIGIILGQNQVRSEYAYQWAIEHYRVNYHFIQECEKQKRKTCNVNTIAPGMTP